MEKNRVSDGDVVMKSHGEVERNSNTKQTKWFCLMLFDFQILSSFTILKGLKIDEEVSTQKGKPSYYDNIESFFNALIKIVGDLATYRSQS
ncbi:hypothetical protein HA466_0108660 [Hirschfeldia incana]|nr:hypothetical protein HA466_0108660 [Hirschfeldia incana]KAJ0254362.1 hypothetical protein HA466_0108660 [Hirschfeldia incana]